MSFVNLIPIECTVEMKGVGTDDAWCIFSHVFESCVIPKRTLLSDNITIHLLVV